MLDSVQNDKTWTTKSGLLKIESLSTFNLLSLEYKQAPFRPSSSTVWEPVCAWLSWEYPAAYQSARNRSAILSRYNRVQRIYPGKAPENLLTLVCLCDGVQSILPMNRNTGWNPHPNPLPRYSAGEGEDFGDVVLY